MRVGGGGGVNEFHAIEGDLIKEEGLEGIKRDHLLYRRYGQYPAKVHETKFCFLNFHVILPDATK